jgi:hypothetical protein
MQITKKNPDNFCYRDFIIKIKMIPYFVTVTLFTTVPSSVMILTM